MFIKEGKIPPPPPGNGSHFRTIESTPRAQTYMRNPAIKQKVTHGRKHDLIRGDKRGFSMKTKRFE